MKMKQALYLGAAAAALALVAISPTQLRAQQSAAVVIDGDDIGGVVSGPGGPEAGVWVIAETNDLATKFAKMVVTDDHGRYLIPDLPKANYTVWVRGYGLVDSPKVTGTPGKLLNLTATPAPTPAAAAEYYPGMYWYSMLKIPAATEFPGTGPKGNGIPPFIQTQGAWIDTIKNSCQSCHALGSKGVRTLSPKLGTFKNSREAWERLPTIGTSDGQHGDLDRAHRPGQGGRALRGLDRLTDRAGSTSPPTAWCGRCSRAATWRASTAGNAGRRSRGRKPSPARCTERAGRSTSSRDHSSRA